MRVLVDATTLDGGHSGAATRLQAMGHAHACRGEVDVVHLIRPDVSVLEGLECLPVPWGTSPLSRARAGRHLDRLAQEQEAVLIHCGALPLAAVRHVPQCLTLHDLRFLDRRSEPSPLRRMWAASRLRSNLSRARTVVAVSHATAESISDQGLFPPDKVEVIPNASSPEIDPVTDPDVIAAFRRRADLHTRYVLFIGPEAPHKNPLLALQVLAEVRQLPGGEDLSLVMAGRVSPGKALSLARRAEGLGIQEAVRFVGPLDHATLSAALTGADAFMVTSFTEGFSIPVVDAQRFGIPVVAVDTGALPEVVGEGGWIVGSEDVTALAKTLLDAVTPSASRDACLARGKVLSAQWSWKDSAVRLEEVWRRVSAEET